MYRWKPEKHYWKCLLLYLPRWVQIWMLCTLSYYRIVYKSKQLGNTSKKFHIFVNFTLKLEDTLDEPSSFVLRDWCWFNIHLACWIRWRKGWTESAMSVRVCDWNERWTHKMHKVAPSLEGRWLWKEGLESIVQTVQFVLL